MALADAMIEMAKEVEFGARCGTVGSPSMFPAALA